jgi:hypothetical protein
MLYRPLTYAEPAPSTMKYGYERSSESTNISCVPSTSRPLSSRFLNTLGNTSVRR